MKKYILLCLAFVGLYSCSDRIDASGNVITLEREVGEFKAIEVESGISATVTMGSQTRLEITADDNILRYIETFVHDDILTIRVKNHTSFRGNPTLRASVGAIELSECSASGGAALKFTNRLITPAIRINLNGGSRYTGSVEANRMTCDLSGGSVMEIAGTSSELALDCWGGSIFGGFEFASDNVNASLSGGSRATITVNESLKVTASGGSTFRYRGNPSQVDRNASGGSVIEPAN